jgi:uncharacterized protein with NRDE domain
MCTLSLFKFENMTRIFMSRDERHARPAERRPQIISDHNKIYGPLDPQSDGTWIAHNENGYWACLLNGYLEQDLEVARAQKQTPKYVSRGEIIPMALSEKDPIAAVKNLKAERYISFQLLVGNAQSHAFYVWDGDDYGPSEFHANFEDRAFLITSSSWERQRVVAARSNLFEGWVKNQPDLIAATKSVPDFHLSEKPSPDIAPLMMRAHTGTKSITALDIHEGKVEMSYFRRNGTSSNFQELKELEAA